MTVFSANGLAKVFNEKILFENIAFGMQEGEKVGIIGKNGAGKTTMMKIIAGLETPDEGNVVINNAVRIEYLEQMPELVGHDTVLDMVLKGTGEINEKMEEFKMLCALPKGMISDEQSHRINELSKYIDDHKGWSLENDAKTILTKLNLTDFDRDIASLSGGLKKRASLAKALVSNPNLLILDEPTNHLDVDSVQWLQDYLQSSSRTILFVTHDRYFLDAIATKIIEIDHERIFAFPGSYEGYLTQKNDIMQIQQSTVDKNLSRLRTELAWLQKGAKARRTKQQSRIDWIEEMRKSAVQVKEKNIKIELGNTFLTSRVVEAINIEKSIGGKLLFQDFTYYAKPGDRIGIIGPNGSGKSTLLKTLCEIVTPDSGTVKIGQSITIGYFKQEIDDLKDTMSVIGAVKEISEYINVGVGRERYLTPRDLLDKFLFPRAQHGALISTLSGGERKRLALIRVLMANPNVLLLDEPTNDFDMQTLNAFEEYLDDFMGVLLIVSHDRSFLDRTVKFIYAFDGLGNIKQYPGNYTYYLEQKEQNKRLSNEQSSKGEEYKKSRVKVKTKLSYHDQREHDELEKLIPQLEQERAALEKKVYSGEESDYTKLQELSNELHELTERIETVTNRWLELADSID